MAARKKSEREREFDRVVGAQLARWRSERNLTQEQLAQPQGISKVTLSQYECGYCGMPLFLLLRFAAVLKVPLKDLVGPAL